LFGCVNDDDDYGALLPFDIALQPNHPHIVSQPASQPTTHPIAIQNPKPNPVDNFRH